MSLATVYQQLLDELGDALASTDLRVATDLAVTLGPRDVVVGPPTFLWQTQCSPNEPDAITYDVFLVDVLGERAVENLLTWLPDLLTAVNLVGDVLTCQPAAYPSGATDLPAYRITAETTL